MNIQTLLTFLLALLCVQAHADEGKITINSPGDGSVLSAKSRVALGYDAKLSADSDHLLLYVDGSRIDVLRQIKGRVELNPLPPGEHRICISLNTKSYLPTGIDACVDITSR